MKFPFLNFDILRNIPLVCFLTFFIHQSVHGQIKEIKKAIGSETSPLPPAHETGDAVRARVEQWYTEAKDTLAKLDGPAASTALPDGVTESELDDRRRGLEGMILIATQWLKNIEAAREAQKKNQPIQTENWSGFKESPPYSILMVDELHNERDSAKARLASSEASLSNYERLFTGVIDETRAAEEAVSTRMLDVQKADPATAAAAKWRLEAAREKSRQLASRSALFQSNCDILKERILTTKSELALIDHKTKIANANFRFTDEDFEKLEKSSAARKQAIQKEVDAITKRLKAAQSPRIQAQAALDALLAAAPAGKEPEGIELAKYRVEVTQGRIDALQSISEWLEGLPQLENLSLEAYKYRREIINARTPLERTAALESLYKLLDRIRAWVTVLENEITNSESDLAQLEFRATSITPEDPRFSLLNEQRASRSEKLTMLQRVSQAVGPQRKLINRWIDEYSPKPGQAGLGTRVGTFASNSWATVRRIWSFEVMSFEDKIVVDGQTITGNIPVTLGMLVRALLFFVIGYQIASRIARRIQNSLVSRGHVAEAQARTLRNWLMIVVGVFLAIGTLSFLKIPLTVFAFFGGALAIGLGFGMQTLIKNFISGIIVLAERKVRVGDIVDVEGIVGTVVEVNTRSSVIRGADDVETMIPNSLFLENRVTNWTLSSSKMRRLLRVGVAYGTSPQLVMEILTESAARHGLISREPEPFAVFEDFGDNALIFTLYFWVDMHGTGNAMVITSDLRLMIEKRFTEAGVGIPFPQRDMHLTTDQPIQVQISNP
jgi:small-conductance mechanosensitive channel